MSSAGALPSWSRRPFPTACHGGCPCAFPRRSRIGQQGILPRVWARNGTRPRIVKDHSNGLMQLFSAACPDTGAAIGYVCAGVNIVGMNRRLRDVGEGVPAGRHALVVLEGAGWHRSSDLEVPANVSLLRLPPYSPKPDAAETLFWP